MILANRAVDFKIPHTSTCTIHTQGRINDGDTVRVSSPVFSSYDITKLALTTSSEFEVPVRVQNKQGYFESDGNHKATLVCDDNDTLNMYVRVM